MKRASSAAGASQLPRRGESERLHDVRIPLERRPERRVATLRITGVRAFQASSFRVRLR